MDDLEPCFRREVFARVGTIVDQCKNVSGIPQDADVPAGDGGLSLGNAFGPADKLKRVGLTISNTSSLQPLTYRSNRLASDVRVRWHHDELSVGAGCSF